MKTSSALALFFSTGALLIFAESASDRRIAEMQAQHVRDLATIQRLADENRAAALSVKQNKNSAQAINQLGASNKQRAIDAGLQGEEHAKRVVQAVEEVKQTAEKTQQDTAVVAAKVDTIKPYDYTPVWLAVIASIGSMFAGVVSIRLATIAATKVAGVRSTVETIHTLTNSTLSEMTNKLQIALEKISGLEKQVTLLTDEPTRLRLLARLQSEKQVADDIVRNIDAKKE